VHEQPQTWHHGLVARYWAEFNDDFRPHEISYFRTFVEGDGQPALDVACGTGRLLLPYLRAGLDVDGCDVSGDMVALCRDKAAREGLSPSLFVQPMHALELARRYRTIYVCGAFGLGSTRDQDVEALRRFHEHLEPGGTLIVDAEAPYADATHWKYWLGGERAELPTPDAPPKNRRRASDGSEYAIRSRLLDVDPLDQSIALEIRAQLWQEDQLRAEETHVLTARYYFLHELRMLVEQAGFHDVVVHGDHVQAAPTAEDEFFVVVGRKPAG
jgi:SAM-dependent methyltransferase